MLTCVSRHALRGRFALAAFVAALSGHAASAQTVVTWTNGSGDGNYSNPLNWNPPTVPINTMANTYTVIIPASQTVNLDFATPANITVTDFQIGANARFILRPGRYYEVLDDADIGGTIEADGSGTIFRATGPGAAITGNAARFIATGSAEIEVAGPSYTYGQQGHTTLASATNDLSYLGLWNISNLVFGAGGGRWFQTIRAANGGYVDLYDLQSISIAPGHDDVLDIVQEADGYVELFNLQTIDGLGNGNGQVRFFTNGSDLYLPKLLTANGTAFSAGTGRDVDLPALTSLTNSVVTQAAGSTFNAPNLVDVSNSTLVMSPDRTFNTGMLSQIDGASIAVQGGMVFDRVSDIELNYARTGHMDLLTVSDPGSVFDVSSASAINYGVGGGRWFQVIRASNSGHMDLSSVASVNVAAGNDDVLDFVEQSGGVIDLSGLQSINFAGNGSSRARFIVSNPSFDLPSLLSASGAQFMPAEGTTINLPFLTSLTGGNVDLAENSVVNAPALTNVSGTDFVVSPTRSFNTGLLASIDNSLIVVTGGLAYNAVSDTGLLHTRTGNNTILSASGPGSVFDGSSLSSIEYGPGSGRWFNAIRATNSAVMDLSGVASISVLAGQDDVLDFVAESGGLIDLSSLQTANAGSGNANARLRFTVTNGGRMEFGNVEVARQAEFTITDVTSTMSVSGNMLLDSGLVSISAGATLSVGGDFTFRYTNEADFAAASAILRLNGGGSFADPQLLEIGGMDIGAMNPGNSGNFGIGQLVLGADGASTVVQLLDVIDNGNRGVLRGAGGESPEALYLFGLGGPDGLILRGGSTLIIDNLNVYTTENNQWVHINSLFPEGVTVIPYSNGFIELPSPGAGLPILAGLIGVALRRRAT